MPDEQAQLVQHLEENEIENKEYPKGAESLLADGRKEKNDYILV